MSNFVNLFDEIAQDSEPEEQSSNKRRLYDILGVEPTATIEEIKSAYKKRALELHPDRHPGDAEVYKERFQEVVEAKDILADPEKRARYDQLGTVETSNRDWQQFWDEFFGKEAFGEAKTSIVVRVTVSEAYIGCSKQVPLFLNVPCRVCGDKTSSGVPCVQCDGRGRETESKGGNHSITFTCSVCKGSGVQGGSCDACGGTQVESVKMNVNVDVPGCTYHETELKPVTVESYIVYPLLLWKDRTFEPGWDNHDLQTTLLISQQEWELKRILHYRCLEHPNGRELGINLHTPLEIERGKAHIDFPESGFFDTETLRVWCVMSPKWQNVRWPWKIIWDDVHEDEYSAHISQAKPHNENRNWNEKGFGLTVGNGISPRYEKPATPPQRSPELEPFLSTTDQDTRPLPLRQESVKSWRDECCDCHQVRDGKLDVIGNKFYCHPCWASYYRDVDNVVESPPPSLNPEHSRRVPQTFVPDRSLEDAQHNHRSSHEEKKPQRNVRGAISPGFEVTERESAGGKKKYSYWLCKTSSKSGNDQGQRGSRCSWLPSCFSASEE